MGKKSIMASTHTCAYGILIYFAERPNIVEKSQKISTKHPKIRKREIFMSHLRERNPEKIGKILQDLAKFYNGTLSRKIVSR